jgi:hypothetical protein
VIIDLEGIKKHVVDFYKQLFGGSNKNDTHLEEGFWNPEEKLDDSDGTLLQEPFIEKYVRLAIEGMKSTSALGPNGSCNISCIKLM